MHVHLQGASVDVSIYMCPYTYSMYTHIYIYICIRIQTHMSYSNTYICIHIYHGVHTRVYI